MKVAIISDTHDQLIALDLVLSKIQELECHAIIHCGDWCSPFTVAEVTKLKLPVYTCMGNNDGDRDNIRKALADSGVEHKVEDEILEVTIDNKRFAINHYPDIVPVLRDSGHYDVVCFGHNHERHLEPEKNVWIANPGALIRNTIAGWGFILYDTSTHQAEFVQLG